MRKFLLVVVIVLAVAAAGILIWYFVHPRPGHVKDEAAAAGKGPEYFKAADEDYFADMDYGETKNPEAVRAALNPYVPGVSAQDAVRATVRGRNNWLVWTGGNDRFWDKLSTVSFGTIDLLKTVSNDMTVDYKYAPGGKQKYGRYNRWQWLGLVNEPCFVENNISDMNYRWGLKLDKRVTGPGCPPDPFENEQKYPGLKIGARGQGKVAVGSAYGYATGIIGLRLFPNPAFDEKAQKHWDPVRYYNDPKYYQDRNLVKPYRVGMACSFCHVGPNPSHLPADPEHPAWADLNSNPGAQYFWVDRIFVWNPEEKSFVYQLFHTSRPGALDTSLVSSDQINNPRTMNAVYNVGPRLDMAKHWGLEHLAGGETLNKQFNDYSSALGANSPLMSFYEKIGNDKGKVYNPRVLKDGSDAVGMLGALNRVYVNIGLFSEEWMLHFIPLAGGPKITPITIAAAEKNSTYWKANETQTPDVALFFLATAKPDLLKNAPGGAAHMSTNAAQLTKGKEVFADRCLRCHSSKLPARAYKDFFQKTADGKDDCNGPKYLQCWDSYWKWTKTAEFKNEARQIVMKPDFADGNAMTTDVRVPVTLLETNACSPLATNALAGDIWDNFSSQSYKSLPSVGDITVHHPYTGEPSTYHMPAGGRGYTRPPSLISIWSTAPFFVNNTLGPFHWKGTLEDRLDSYDKSIHQLLYPQDRDGKQYFMTKSGKLAPGVIDRTSQPTYLIVRPGFLPSGIAGFTKTLSKALPNVFGDDGGLALGPIPSGTPINLLSNVDLSKIGKLAAMLPGITHDLKTLPKNPSDEEARKQFAPLLPKLLDVCKCPDFVVNRGHYFGTDYLPASEGEPGLTDEEKAALIEYLKTF